MDNLNLYKVNLTLLLEGVTAIVAAMRDAIEPVDETAAEAAPAAKPKRAPKPEKLPNPVPVDDVPPFEPDVSEAKPAPAFTLEDVRAVLAEKSRQGLTAEVRALLQQFGADKLSEVDPARYSDLLKAAEGLVLEA